jgi:hypothetical protein
MRYFRSWQRCKALPAVEGMETRPVRRPSATHSASIGRKIGNQNSCGIYRSRMVCLSRIECVNPSLVDDVVWRYVSLHGLADRICGILTSGCLEGGQYGGFGFR